MMDKDGHLRFVRRLLLAAALLGSGATGRRAQAQDEDEPEANVPPQPVYILGEQYFNQVVYGGRNNAETTRARLEHVLTMRIEDVARTLQITDVVKAKLQLAGRGDIKRLFDRIEDKRKLLNVPYDRNKYMEVSQEIRKLQVAGKPDPFGAGSLFSKTLKTVLTAPQWARYENGESEATRFRFRARVELVVASLDEALGLSADQRLRLVTLLQEETRPPRQSGPYDQQVLLLQAARLPEAKIRAIVDEAQWRVLSRRLDQARRLEPMLRNNFVLPDDR